MEIQFIKTSPTQNMTLLIETPVAEAEQLALAERLIAYDSVYAEQAGFIQEPKNPKAKKALRMMAGEFCGNATLSLAAWLMEAQRVAVGTKEEMLLEVSGATDLVRCEITKTATGYMGVVDMPLPIAIEEKLFSLDGENYRLPVVSFSGITHVIVPQELWGNGSREKAEQAAKVWAKDLPHAFGILLWQEETATLTPLVSVQNVSLIWEKCCGSGTAAIGAYLGEKAGSDISLTCQEPGGEMGVTATVAEGKVTSLRIQGGVSIVARGTAYL